MIKVCSKAPNPINLGNVTIPAYGSVLLASFPSSLEVNRLMNKGIISAFYVEDEISTQEPEQIVDNFTTEEKTTITTEDVVEIKDSVTIESNDITTETPTTSTRKRRTHKETVSLIDNNTNETNEPNITKGDMNNASD